MKQEELIELLKGNQDLKEYSKFGTFKYRKCVREEEIVTIIAGEEETTNTAYPDDYIMTGHANNEYVVPKSTWLKKYEPLAEYDSTIDNMCKAKGKCWGIQYSGEPITFKAKWGEDMICNPGDMLVSPDDSISEVYRIEIGEFNNTYKLNVTENV